ncbi:MAG: glutamate--tRNA ligase [Planctomycetota bacterium]
MTATPRLRFAPSPTGPLHLGGARTALYNWAAARAMGGRFVLRIEDTDQVRSTEASLRIILDGLRWLGIDWDEGPDVGGEHGPYFQMQRLHLYREAAQSLLASGHAYRCYCTPEEVERGRAAMRAEKKGFYGYDGRCRDLDPDQRAARERDGRKPSLRFRMPESRELVVRDLIRGDVRVDTRELDDWVMMRPDGVPLYNFACVVDDLAMEITHVVRGEEHFLNGVKQQLLFEALGGKAPLYAHIPLILNKEGKKLSKRDADTNMLDYRDKGYLPEAVFNYIALLGWGFSGERDLFSREEMIERFRIEDIGKAGARFDEEKLLWMSGEYARRLSRREFARRAAPFIRLPEGVGGSPWIENALACYQERVRIFGELPEKIAWLLGDSVARDPAAEKNLRKHDAAREWLVALADLLQGMDLPPSLPADRGDCDREVLLPSRPEDRCEGAPCSTPKDIERECRALCERLGAKFGHFVHPVRAAITGTDRGPGLFDCIFLLGKQRCCARLRAAALDLA